VGARCGWPAHPPVWQMAAWFLTAGASALLAVLVAASRGCAQWATCQRMPKEGDTTGGHHRFHSRRGIAAKPPDCTRCSQDGKYAPPTSAPWQPSTPRTRQANRTHAPLHSLPGRRLPRRCRREPARLLGHGGAVAQQVDEPPELPLLLLVPLHALEPPLLRRPLHRCTGPQAAPQPRTPLAAACPCTGPQAAPQPRAPLAAALRGDRRALDPSLGAGAGAAASQHCSVGGSHGQTVPRHRPLACTWLPGALRCA
jgi:hypothetical protein